MIGANALLLCSRDVSGNIAEKSGRVTEWGESREAEFKEVFAEQEHHLSTTEHAQFT
jgi:hypothetical protein